MAADTTYARRALDLLVELMYAERGRSRAQIAQLPGYRDLSEEAFTKALYRERAYLRECGIEIEAQRLRDGSEHYRLLPPTHVPSELTLSADDIELIHLAASSWKNADRILSQSALSAKTRAYAQEITHLPPHLSVNLEGAEVVAACDEGIRTRSVLSFVYRSLNGTDLRSVEPWKLIARGRALYLWGHDLDREAPRMYRLSRMVAPIEFLGEAGDASPMPSEQGDPLSSFMLSPIFSMPAHMNCEELPFDASPWVPAESPKSAELSETVAPDGSEPTCGTSTEASSALVTGEKELSPRDLETLNETPAHLRLYRGEKNTRGVWITRFLTFPDLRPRAPYDFCEDIRRRLNAAQQWEGHNA